MNEDITIRKARRSDMDELIDFYVRLDDPCQGPWIKIMMDGSHPYTKSENFIVAEHEGTIVASIINMPWTYMYDGTPIPVSRLEQVFCEPAFQGRGIIHMLMKKTFDETNRSGSVMDVVYGKPGLYNHFGFTLALPNENEGYTFLIPECEADNGCFSFRKAENADLDAIAKLYINTYQRNMISLKMGLEELNYIKNIYPDGAEMYVITNGNKICGFFYIQGETIFILELDESVSAYLLRPALINFFKSRGKDEFRIKCGSEHPMYEVLDHCYKKKHLSELGYVKIPDTARFIKAIAPVLNKRLSMSPYAHLSLKFTLCMENNDDCCEIEFNQGKLVDAQQIKQDYGDIHIHRNLFVKLAVGRNSVSEMELENSELNFDSTDLRNIFHYLFPKRNSYIFSAN